MTEQEALSIMVSPGARRKGKYLEGVIQVHITRACDRACFHCTQGSNLAGKTEFMSPEHFEQAILSLQGFHGVRGVFGGNPATSPHFIDYCEILQRLVPKHQCGLWCNNPLTPEKTKAMRKTFDPAVSNLNVHLDSVAYEKFKTYWPESRPFGLHEDSRHSPCYVAMKDVIEDEEKRWELISDCDINKHWSAMIGVFRGELRAWFCEIAGAQAMLHQWETEWVDDAINSDHPEADLVYTYPDTGLDPLIRSSAGRWWWDFPMQSFAHQVRKHCHECSVPLRGHGELAQSKNVYSTEQVSQTHVGVYKLKNPRRLTEVVTEMVQLGTRLPRMTDYLQNAKR